MDNVRTDCPRSLDNDPANDGAGSPPCHCGLDPQSEPALPAEIAGQARNGTRGAGQSRSDSSDSGNARNDGHVGDPASDGTDDGFRSGFVTLVGRPNAGKSTLVNAALGKKIAITSEMPQTTRHRFRAVLDRPGYQLVLVDTPGIHKPHDALGEELNRSARKAVESVDAIGFVLDASKPFGRGDAWILQALQAAEVPMMLVLSKTDLADDAQIAAQAAAAQAERDFDAVVALSAHSGSNLQSFIDTAAGFLPAGPRWFPAGTSTDQPLEVIVAEFIREKALTSTFDEVPYAVGVQVEELAYDKAKGLYTIYAIIYVERESQKGILIGRRGEMIKRIGTQARLDLARFLGAAVFLDLRVKLRKGWRRDANQIRRFGYGDGA